MKGRVLKKKLLPALAALALLGGNSLAESIEVRNVAELVKPADMIARVMILSVRETAATEGAGRIATARVAEAFKGIEAGEIFELENDYVNVACPNVRYETGEDVLLFALKQSGGRYSTLYADAGKIPVAEGKVSRRPFKDGQSYESAVAEVRREVEKLAGLAASNH